jgi:hypothetical protein
MGQQLLRFAQHDKIWVGLDVRQITISSCDFGGVNLERCMLAPQKLCHPERSEGPVVGRATSASEVVIG